MYRAAPQSPSAARYLVPKPVQAPGPASLDPRGAFVVQAEAAVYVWEVRRPGAGRADGEREQPGSGALRWRCMDEGVVQPRSGRRSPGPEP